ncbi:MAG TPA: DUF6294 family protein [Pseudonocardiaceae bacterium]|jgi:hypothetical protein|nr:DUF6294 family protein [Pseudonocardiaceae bacterium]
MKLISWGLKSAVATAAVGAALLAGVPAANAATDTAHVTVSPHDSKSAVWGELHVGDCQEDNGTITLNSDGTGSWTATTLTYQTHSGDVWHASFDFYTTAGTHLFAEGTFNSPRMNDGNPPPQYNWGATFSFDAALYSAVDLNKSIQHSSC